MIPLNETELKDKLESLIKSGEPFIWVETEEIARATKLVEKIVSGYLAAEKAKDKSAKFVVWEYDLESGMFAYNWAEKVKTDARRSLGAPIAELQCVTVSTASNNPVRRTIPASKVISTTLDICQPNTLVIMPCLGALMDVGNAEEVMLASNIVLKATIEVVHTDARCISSPEVINTLGKKDSAIIALGPRPKPAALEAFARNQIHWIALGRPTKDEHREYFRQLFTEFSTDPDEKKKKAADESLKKNDVKTEDELFELLGLSAMGLTQYEMVQATFLSLQKHRYMDAKAISNARQEIINSTPGLKMVPYDEAKDWVRVKGLENMRTLTQKVLNRKNKKGMSLLFVGPPGCGKTMTAQAIAQEMKRAFIQMRLDQMLGNLVGDSEKALNRALSVIDSLGACVVLIDEAEKQLSGTVNTGKGGGNDLTERLGAILLSWENDRKGGAIIIKTANRPDNLAAEMVRRSPIKIFLDLPLRKAREEMIVMYMKDEDIVGDNFDHEFANKLSNDLIGWSGDDIRNLIEIAHAFGDDFEMAKTYIKPQYQTRAAEIVAQRKAGMKLGTSLAECSFEKDCGDDMPLELKIGEFAGETTSKPDGD